MDFNLKQKMVGYMPYGVILYLLCGGAGMPELYDVDMQAANYVATQAAPKIDQSQSTLKKYWNKYVSEKEPNGELPGKAQFSNANLPEEKPKENGLERLMRSIVDLPKKITGSGTDYGY